MEIQSVSGIVEQVFTNNEESKLFNTKNGPKCNHVYVVNGVRYTDKFKDPNAPAAAAKGDMVSFSAKYELYNGKSKMSIVAKTFQKTAATQAPTTTAPVASGSVSHDDRQVAIELQSSRRDAIAFLDVMIKNDTGLVTKVTSKSDKLMVELVEHYTRAFYNMNETIKSNPTEFEFLEDKKKATK
jgi:hypothetical protein